MKQIQNLKARLSSLIALWIAVQLLAAQGMASGQQKQSPAAHEMTTFYMVFLIRGARSTPEQTPELERLHAQHVEHIVKLLNEGRGVIAGPLGDDGRIAGILVLRASSPEEAKSVAEGDPAVKSGEMAVEVHPWFAAKDVFKTLQSPLSLVQYYIGFLKRGPKWTPEVTPETQQLQAAHMANLNQMAQSGKLVIAGPFEDSGQMRGVFVFKVASLEEAKALAEADPAVRAGRLSVEVHPWMVPKGMLP